MTIIGRMESFFLTDFVKINFLQEEMKTLFEKKKKKNTYICTLQMDNSLKCWNQFVIYIAHSLLNLNTYVIMH